MELKVEELRTYPGLGSKDGMINWNEVDLSVEYTVEVDADDKVDLMILVEGLQLT